MNELSNVRLTPEVRMRSDAEIDERLNRLNRICTKKEAADWARLTLYVEASCDPFMLDALVNLMDRRTAA